MSYKERILDYLWSVAPGGATNGQIARALGISSQQTVYMTTQELAGRRLIRAAKEGATWVFYTLDAQADGVAVRACGPSKTSCAPPSRGRGMRGEMADIGRCDHHVVAKTNQQGGLGSENDITVKRQIRRGRHPLLPQLRPVGRRLKHRRRRHGDIPKIGFELVEPFDATPFARPQQLATHFVIGNLGNMEMRPGGC